MRSKLPLLFLTVSVTAFIISLFFLIPGMPERIATHFDSVGCPNGWMSRGQHLTGIMVLGIALPGFVIGICHCILLYPPSTLTFSDASYWRTQEQYLSACRLLINWSYYFGGISFIWVGLLNYQLMDANRLNPPRLPPSPVLILSGAYLLLTAITVAVLIFRLTKTK